MKILFVKMRKVVVLLTIVIVVCHKPGVTLLQRIAVGVPLAKRRVRGVKMDCLHKTKQLG